MYILCEKSPCMKKTPLVYEMDTRSICPVCGEQIESNIFDSATDSVMNVMSVNGHCVSTNPNFLMTKKSHILTIRALMKGATT